MKEVGYEEWEFPVFIVNALKNDSICPKDMNCRAFAQEMFEMTIGKLNLHSTSAPIWGVDMEYLQNEEYTFKGTELECLCDRIAKFGGDRYEQYIFL